MHDWDNGLTWHPPCMPHEAFVVDFNMQINGTNDNGSDLNMTWLYKFPIYIHDNGSDLNMTWLYKFPIYIHDNGSDLNMTWLYKFSIIHT